eukprot:g4049.t1
MRIDRGAAGDSIKIFMNFSKALHSSSEYAMSHPEHRVFSLVVEKSEEMKEASDLESCDTSHTTEYALSEESMLQCSWCIQLSPARHKLLLDEGSVWISAKDAWRYVTNVRFRVRLTNSAFGEWSHTHPSWRVARDCDHELQYLSIRKHDDKKYDPFPLYLSTLGLSKGGQDLTFRDRPHCRDSPDMRRPPTTCAGKATYDCFIDSGVGGCKPCKIKFNLLTDPVSLTILLLICILLFLVLYKLKRTFNRDTRDKIVAYRNIIAKDGSRTIKLMADFLQVVISIPLSYSIPIPDALQQFFAMFQFFNLNVFKFLRIGCVTPMSYYDEVFGLIVIFLVFLMLVFLTYCFGKPSLRNEKIEEEKEENVEMEARKKFRKPTTFEHLQNGGNKKVKGRRRSTLTTALNTVILGHHSTGRHMKFAGKVIERKIGKERAALIRFRSTCLSVIVYVSVLCHMPLTSQLFAFFKCKRVVDEHDIHYYLMSDLSKQCFDEEWTTNAFVIIAAVILYTISVPVILFLALFRKRKKLGDPIVMLEVGFLYMPYKRRWYFWEMVSVTRKLLIINVAVILYEYPVMQAGYGIALSVFFHVAHSHAKAHKDKWIGYLEHVVLLTTFLTLFSTLLLFGLGTHTNEQCPPMFLNASIAEIDERVSCEAMGCRYDGEGTCLQADSEDEPCCFVPKIPFHNEIAQITVVLNVLCFLAMISGMIISIARGIYNVNTVRKGLQREKITKAHAKKEKEEVQNKKKMKNPNEGGGNKDFKVKVVPKDASPNPKGLPLPEKGAVDGGEKKPSKRSNRATGGMSIPKRKTPVIQTANVPLSAEEEAAGQALIAAQLGEGLLSAPRKSVGRQLLEIVEEAKKNEKPNASILTADEDAAGEYLLQQRRALHAVIMRNQAQKYLNTLREDYTSFPIESILSHLRYVMEEGVENDNSKCRFIAVNVFKSQCKLALGIMKLRLVEAQREGHVRAGVANEIKRIISGISAIEEIKTTGEDLFK